VLKISVVIASIFHYILHVFIYKLFTVTYGMILPEAVLEPYIMKAELMFYCKSKSAPKFYELINGTRYAFTHLQRNTIFLTTINFHYRNRVLHCKGTLEDGKRFVARAYIFGASKKINKAESKHVI